MATLGFQLLFKDSKLVILHEKEFKIILKYYLNFGEVFLEYVCFQTCILF